MDIQHIQKLDQGKQGVTGIVTIDGVQHVYKISRYMNYLTSHEYTIMKDLEQAPCPHFCRATYYKTLPIHPCFRDSEQDPFESHDRPILMDVLFTEYIDDSISLYNLINCSIISFSQIIGYIKQVLAGLIIAQRHSLFAHYDLHSFNILMRECEYDQVHLYKLDEDNVLCVPTYGYVPVIIDYGFGTSKGVWNQPATISFNFTDAGYMAPVFDSMVDARILLVSIADDLRKHRSASKYTAIFRNIVQNLFKSLAIDWKSGWDRGHNENVQSILDEISDQLPDPIETSEVFGTYKHVCMDILQSLVIFPLVEPSAENVSLTTLQIAYETLVTEFYKIEQTLSNSFYALYVFRTLVDLIRKRTGDTTDTIENRLRDSLSFSIDTASPSGSVRYDLLIAAIESVGEQIGYHIYPMVSAILATKELAYQKLEIQCVEHIFTILDTNFTNAYRFNRKTKCILMDVPKGTSRTITNISDADLEYINALPQYARGGYINRTYAS